MHFIFLRFVLPGSGFGSPDGFDASVSSGGCVRSGAFGSQQPVVLLGGPVSSEGSWPLPGLQGSQPAGWPPQIRFGPLSSWILVNRKLYAAEFRCQCRRKSEAHDNVWGLVARIGPGTWRAGTFIGATRVPLTLIPQQFGTTPKSPAKSVQSCKNQARGTTECSPSMSCGRALCRESLFF